MIYSATTKCTGMFILATSNNVSKGCERLFPVRKDTAFTLFGNKISKTQLSDHDRSIK